MDESVVDCRRASSYNGRIICLGGARSLASILERFGDKDLTVCRYGPQGSSYGCSAQECISNPSKRK